MSLRLSKNNDTLAKDFLELKSARDVSALLEVEYSTLVYHLFKTPDDKKYSTFEIPKKNGNNRKITTPISPIKIIQSKLNQVLNAVYPFKPSVHGFVQKKSIVSNAAIHSNQNYVFNLDLLNFFPSINFGRVRGMFMGYPYNLNANVATTLAQICCYKNELPQGAPTSPIISNMICAKLDSRLQRLAGDNRCHYTRYADDITFSTKRTNFPKSLALDDEQDKEIIRVSPTLEKVINSNGFSVNQSKVRLQSRLQRQSVTGLVVNKFPNVKRNYVRQIRAMLYDWERNGLTAAENRYLTKFNNHYRKPGATKVAFKEVVRGKIDFLKMVKGKTNPVYLKLFNKFKTLDPDSPTPSTSAIVQPEPVTLTVGVNSPDLTTQTPLIVGSIDRTIYDVNELLVSINNIYKSKNNEDLFKLTTAFLESLIIVQRKKATDKDTFKDVIDALYKMFYEGSGALNRIPDDLMPDDSVYFDIKHLRTSLFHDVEHGNQSDIDRKIQIIKDIFKKYTSKEIIDALDDKDFLNLQLKLYQSIHKALIQLKHRILQ